MTGEEGPASRPSSGAAPVEPSAPPSPAPDPSGDLPRNVKLTVEYEGTRYNGWQAQRDHASVQGELERAAARVVDHPVTLHGSGRTDRGVHALGQVANFHTRSAIPLYKLRLGMNTYLPDDIRVRAAEEAAPGFHARYSAEGKRYRYLFLRDPPPPPGSPAPSRVLSRRFAAVVPHELDIAAMRRGALHLRGVHDFRAFEGASRRRLPGPGDPPRSTVRTVAGVFVSELGPYVLIDAVGKGFLYGMVRAIAGTLLEVGSGTRAAEDVQDVLRSRDRRRAGLTAPARGLILLVVYYEPEAMSRAVEALSERGSETDEAARGMERDLKLLL